MIDAVANGAQQIVTEGAANFGAWVPSISVVEAPYVWRDAAHLQKAMSGPVGQKFNDTLVKARGMRILGTTYYGTRHLTTTQKEVKTPADLVGFKLRVPENDVFKAMAEAWGAKPTPMNFGELYLALKQNVVDGQENPLPTIKSGKFDEVQKYLVLSGHIITPRLVVVNEAFWQGLSAADRKLLEDAIAAGIAWQDEELAKQEKSLVDTFKAAGMTVITPDAERVPRAGARQGAEDVRGEVGRRHVRGDPGDPVTSVRGRSRARRSRTASMRTGSPMTASRPRARHRRAGDRLLRRDVRLRARAGRVPLLPRLARSPGATSSRATCSSGARSSAG